MGETQVMKLMDKLSELSERLARVETMGCTEMKRRITEFGEWAEKNHMVLVYAAGALVNTTDNLVVKGW